MSLIIYAPNVHVGGGRTLLISLLEAAPDARAILDKRLTLPASIPDKIIISRTEPNIFARWRAETILQRCARPGDVVLCFGNLPPLRRISGRLFLLIQNRYLVGNYCTKAFPLFVRLRTVIERIWLRAGVGKVDNIVVQSPSMAREVEAVLGIAPLILPFVPENTTTPKSNHPRGVGRRYDFLYVASAAPHKNHRTLISAWVMLAKKNIRPSLALTINPVEAPDLFGWMEFLTRQHDLRIDLIGTVPHRRVMELYEEVGALIYPSFFESLGLPLLEASYFGLPILAGELDYVRDVIDPVETFDPSSPASIARAVGRYLNKPIGKAPILTTTEFVSALLNR